MFGRENASFCWMAWMRLRALSKFDVYELAPFTKEQALQLIDQLVYRPESPELKASFRREAMKVSGKHIGIL